MRIPKHLTDESFIALAKPEGTYANSNEFLGELAAITNQLHEALLRSNNMISTEVLVLLVRLEEVSIKASREFLHK